MTPGQIDDATNELRRAQQALREARLLIDADSLEGAVSRLYYAVFHATRAALVVAGRSARTHSGQVSMFTETYGAAPVLGRLLELRARADYGFGELSATRGTILEHVGEAEELVRRCADIVAEAADRGADEPDPPADH